MASSRRSSGHHPGGGLRRGVRPRLTTFGLPVLAEGHVNTPDAARGALQAGLGRLRGQRHHPPPSCSPNSSRTPWEHDHRDRDNCKNALELDHGTATHLHHRRNRHQPSGLGRTVREDDRRGQAGRRRRRQGRSASPRSVSPRSSTSAPTSRRTPSDALTASTRKPWKSAATAGPNSSNSPTNWASRSSPPSSTSPVPGPCTTWASR